MMTTEEMATLIEQDLHRARDVTHELKHRCSGDTYLRDVEADITAAIAAYEKWRRMWEQDDDEQDMYCEPRCFDCECR